MEPLHGERLPLLQASGGYLGDTQRRSRSAGAYGVGRYGGRPGDEAKMTAEERRMLAIQAAQPPQFDKHTAGRMKARELEVGSGRISTVQLYSEYCRYAVLSNVDTLDRTAYLQYSLYIMYRS